MKPEAKLIAIGKHLGLLNPRIDEAGTLVSSIGIDRHGQYWGSTGHPDYLNDLNAMHEAEMWLLENNPDAFERYLKGLLAVVDLCGGYYLCATAAQRADAFVKTIGKWEEDA